MGRFATTVDFYARYREPYPATFFKTAAERIGLRGKERLLDIACGPGLLGIGFAPYVGECTGLDPEGAMIAAAKSGAEQAGVSLRLIHGRIEDFATEHKFDILTIGRAIHWMERSRALEVLGRITANSGHILICGASSTKNAAPMAGVGGDAMDRSAADVWVKLYDAVRRAWALEPNKRTHLAAKEWFEGSPFRELDRIEVSEERQVTIAELIGRALSKSSTSPAVLGERRAAFEAEIAAVLEPFAQDGVLREEIVARAWIFGRQTK